MSYVVIPGWPETQAYAIISGCVLRWPLLRQKVIQCDSTLTADPGFTVLLSSLYLVSATQEAEWEHHLRRGAQAQPGYHSEAQPKEKQEAVSRQATL